MSVISFSEFLGQLSINLPTEDVVLAIFNRNKSMGAEVLIEVVKSKMITTQSAGAYLKLIKSTVEDLNDKDVIDDIIYFLDEYYPNLIKQISENEQDTALTLAVLEGLLKVVRDAN